MKTRIITALLGFLALLAILFWGGRLFIFVLWAATALAMYEYYHAIEVGGKHPIKFVGYAATLMFPVYAIYSYFHDFYVANSDIILGAILLLSISLLYILYGICVVKSSEYNFQDAAQTIFSVLYICVPMFMILPLYFGANGKLLIWILLIIAWGTDIFAYFIGVFFGKNKMMPELSPKKTWEGFFGGLFGATLLMTIYGLAVSSRFDTFDWWVYSILGLVLSLVSQFGDWFASSIKRNVKIKDFGNILPGHGGFIDRFDSIIFIAPLVYIFTIFFNR